MECLDFKLELAADRLGGLTDRLTLLQKEQTAWEARYVVMVDHHVSSNHARDATGYTHGDSADVLV